MEGLNEFDDDLISIRIKEKKPIVSYNALCCEPTWFTHSSHSVSSNEFYKLKYEADFRFLKGDYKKSVMLYERYNEQNPNITAACRRECIEGIARSYLQLSCYLPALQYAKELYKLSSTYSSYTSSLFLLYHSYLYLQNYSELILVGQRLVNLHYSNSDIWLQLVIAYALFYKVPLKYLMQVPGNYIWFNALKSYCEDSKPMGEVFCSFNDNLLGKYKVLICLLHCNFHLKSIIVNSVGYLKDISLRYHQCVLSEIGNISICNELKLMELVNEFYKEVRVEITESCTLQNSDCEKIEVFLNENIGKVFEEKWLLLEYMDAK